MRVAHLAQNLRFYLGVGYSTVMCIQFVCINVYGNLGNVAQCSVIINYVFVRFNNCTLYYTYYICLVGYVDTIY